MKKTLLLGIMCLVTLAINAQSYVDLGLSSGTLWKNSDEHGLYTYDEAVSNFGNKLPQLKHFEELKEECKWTWTGSGYKVVGPNGNYIILNAAGLRSCNGSMAGEGTNGYYWSSKHKDSEYAGHLDFNAGKVRIKFVNRCEGQSVRLILKKSNEP